MTCPCGNTDHDYQKLLDGVAKEFLKNRRELVWNHWSDKNHRNAMSEEFMKDITDRIKRFKADKSV
jgi:enoyl-CoA hydratase/carnithine racemase